MTDLRPKTPEERSAERERRKKAEALRIDQAWREVLSTPLGRLLISYIVYRRCGVRSQLWRPGAEIHATAACNDLGVSLLEEIGHASPSSYLRLEMERVELEAQSYEDDLLEEQEQERSNG